MENRLYVGNLSDEVSSEALRKRFAEFGEVSTVHLATDRSSGRLRGHAFVTMATAAEAQLAMSRLNGAVFDERRLRVNVAGEERDRSRSELANPARITSQFRERFNMVYELDCGGVRLTIKTFPEDAAGESWRIEATDDRVPSDGVVVSASAPTRAVALAEVARSWQASRSSAIDWAAVTSALAAVRGL